MQGKHLYTQRVDVFQDVILPLSREKSLTGYDPKRKVQGGY